MPTSVQIYCPADQHPFATSVHSSGHYMLDQFGQPMIMAGASDQSFQNLTVSDIQTTYFPTRAAQGFNWAQAIIIGSNEEDLTSNTPNWGDIDGNPPFYQSNGTTPGTGPNDYDVTQPYPGFWARIDALFTAAQVNGITLLLELLCGGVYASPTNHGFFAATGTTKLATFATWFANRYKSFTYHYLWGYDHFRSIPDGWAGTDPYLIAMLNASRAANPKALHTIENEDSLWTTNQTTGSALDLPGDDTAFTMGGGGAASLDLNWCYTAEDNSPDMLRGYNQNFPTFFGEGKYENAPNNYPAGKNNWSNLLNRKYCYYPMVNGGCGTYYGHDNVWHFGTGWQGQLATTATAHFTIWRNFMTSFAWWKLVPDQTHVFVTAGYPTTGFPYPTRFGVNGAVAADGTVGLVYLGANQSVTIDMTKMRGLTNVRWFDPTNATYTAIGSISGGTGAGTHVYTSSTNNAAGDPDWVLLLTA